MAQETNSIGAAKAKAQFLSLLDEVEAKREPVIITKNGRPVAQLVPMPLSADQEDPIFGFFRGKLEFLGDVISPIYTDAELDEFERQNVQQWNELEQETRNDDAAA